VIPACATCSNLSHRLLSVKSVRRPSEDVKTEETKKVMATEQSIIFTIDEIIECLRDELQTAGDIATINIEKVKTLTAEIVELRDENQRYRSALERIKVKTETVTVTAYVSLTQVAEIHEIATAALGGE
jgi:hypothetical protein